MNDIFNDLSAYLSIQAGILFQAIWYQIRIHIFDTTPSVIAQLFFFKMQLKLLRLNNKGWNLLSAKFGIKEQNNVNYIFGIYCICLYLNSINFRYPRFQHEQFEFSTDLENLKTNQTGETPLTIVTTENIYLCQKVENIYHCKKNITRKHSFHNEIYILLHKKIFTPM